MCNCNILFISCQNLRSYSRQCGLGTHFSLPYRPFLVLSDNPKKVGFFQQHPQSYLLYAALLAIGTDVILVSQL